jgi:hypothetical protein
MSAADSQAGSDVEDDDPANLTREEVRRLRRIARDAERRKDKEQNRDDL